jgi:hypothetical protein
VAALSQQQTLLKREVDATGMNSRLGFEMMALADGISAIRVATPAWSTATTIGLM